MTTRPALTPDRIVDAAARVADRGGLTAVSMRRVGQELGVEAMSLYHHISGKEALLDSLAEWVYLRITTPDPTRPWREAMEQRAHSAREVLTAHPWALGLIESRRSPGPANLAHHDAVLGNLRTGGFPVRLAAHAYSVLDAYVYGFALTEVNLPIQTGTDAMEMAAELAAAAPTATSTSGTATTSGPASTSGTASPAATYPHLFELMGELIGSGDYTYGSAEFDYGLTLILDGLDERLRLWTEKSPALG